MLPAGCRPALELASLPCSADGGAHSWAACRRELYGLLAELAWAVGSGIVGQPVTWDMDGEQYVSVISGWGGAVPLWGGEVAKKVNFLNQGGLLWTFKMPKELASAE